MPAMPAEWPKPAARYAHSEPAAPSMETPPLEFGAAVASPAVAEGAPREEYAAAAPARAPGEWQFAAAPSVWLLDVDGTVANGARTLPVSAHVGDATGHGRNAFDLSFAGRLEARRGDWSVFLQADSMNVGAERGASRAVLSAAGAASADLDFDLDLALVEIGAAWKAAEFRVAEGRTAPVEILGGVRWNHMDVDAGLSATTAGPRGLFDRTFDADFTTDWVDPFIGVRTVVPLSDCVSLHLRGDVGGGFGSGSDVAWNVVAGLSIAMTEDADLFVGYRWYDVERDVSGRDTDLQIEGPGIGLTIRF